MTVPPDLPAVPLTHPWCPADAPYPASYAAALAADPTQCVTLDPCLPDGSTLWTLQPCDPHPTTSTSVSPALPATGNPAAEFATGFAASLLAFGLVCVLLTRRRR